MCNIKSLYPLFYVNQKKKRMEKERMVFVRSQSTFRQSAWRGSPIISLWKFYNFVLNNLYFEVTIKDNLFSRRL